MLLRARDVNPEILLLVELSSVDYVDESGRDLSAAWFLKERRSRHITI
jgi:hypothetical protein